MHTILIGYDRGTGKKQELHLTEEGTYQLIEGDWLWGAFKRKAKHLTKKNGFSYEDWTGMEAIAINDLMTSTDCYDPSKGDRKGYLNTAVANALREAAKAIADERSIWGTRQSLDAFVGGDGEGATHKDRILDGAGLEANKKLIGEPKCRVITRLLRERKEDERAKRALLNRLAAETVVQPDAEESDDSPETPTVDAFAEEMPDNDPETEERLETEHRSMEAMHGEAVREMGLGEDEDEKIETSGGKTRLTGFGDSVSSLYLNTLHLDVAIVMQKLEPRLKRWCELMFEGYTPTEAYKKAGFKTSEWYAKALPNLRKAFAHLRYAL